MAQTASKEEVFEFPAGGIADFYLNDNEFEEMNRKDAEREFGGSGIANFQDVATRMASYGRYGDDRIVHAETGELVVPKALIEDNPELRDSIFSHLRDMGVKDPERYVVGSGANSLNPETGLPEFFLKKIFKKVTRAVKKIGKSVVKLVKKIAPIVIPFALNALFPGMGAIYQGALGAGIGTLVQGGDLKDAFKSALIGGALGGAVSGVQGAMAAKTAGTSMTQGALDGIKNAAKFSNLTTAGKQLMTGQFGQAGLDAVTMSPEALGAPVAATSPGDVVAQATDLDAATRNQLYGVQPRPVVQGAGVPSAYGPDPMAMGSTGGVGDQSAMFTSGVPTPDASSLNISTQTTPSSFMDTVSEYSTKAGDLLTRGGQTSEAVAGAQAAAEQKAIQDTLTKYGFKGALVDAPAKIAAEAIAQGKAAAAAAAPGMLATYGPSLALAGTAAYAGGFFDTPEEDPVDIPPTGAELIAANPEKYRVQNLASYASSGPTEVASPYTVIPGQGVFTNPFFRPDFSVRPVQSAAQGGEIFPRRTGGIMPNEGIPGQDSVRAMLMPGEFVMTTDAVKGLGNGNNQQGINNMYQMMRGLEAKGKAMA